MRLIIIVTSVLCALVLLGGTALAKNTKYTFNDVTYPDGTVGEIEAGVKETNKSEFTNCSYFTDDYIEWLGYYEQAGVAPQTAADVLAFCLDHFEERQQ